MKYLVISLDFSLLCQEDEYPVSNSFVNIHTLTESLERAQKMCDDLQEDFDVHNERNRSSHIKKAVLIQVPDDFTSKPGMTAIWLRETHDTLQSMLDAFFL